MNPLKPISPRFDDYTGYPHLETNHQIDLWTGASFAPYFTIKLGHQICRAQILSNLRINKFRFLEVATKKKLTLKLNDLNLFFSRFDYPFLILKPLRYDQNLSIIYSFFDERSRELLNSEDYKYLALISDFLNLVDLRGSEYLDTRGSLVHDSFFSENYNVIPPTFYFTNEYLFKKNFLSRIVTSSGEFHHFDYSLLS